MLKLKIYYALDLEYTPWYIEGIYVILICDKKVGVTSGSESVFIVISIVIKYINFYV